MSVEEDIGGLKADMATVKGQTSKIFDRIESLSEHVIEHSAKTTAQITHLGNLGEKVQEDIGTVESRVDNLEQSRTRAKWYLMGIGGGGALGGASLIEVIVRALKGGG